MSLYVLDTDSLSLFERRHPILSVKVEATSPDELAVTIITIREQLNGWLGLLNRVQGPEEEARIHRRLAETVRIGASFQMLTYTVATISRFNGLKAMKLNVGSMDLRIAAIVLENNATLVTRNRRDFERIPGLMIEDWTEEV